MGYIQKNHSKNDKEENDFIEKSFLTFCHFGKKLNRRAFRQNIGKSNSLPDYVSTLLLKLSKIKIQE